MRRAKIALLVAAAAVVLLLVAIVPADAQCAMCRTALESSAEGRALIAKLNVGILLLLAAPLAVTAAIAIGMRRSRSRLESAG